MIHMDPPSHRHFRDLLARAEIEGHPLTPHQLVSYCLFLVAGGTETTRNAPSGGMLGFFEFSDQWQALVDDPDQIPIPTEELLRWSTPVIQMARTPVRNVELRGHTIRAGETLALFYGSANRDERVFADPMRLDITDDIPQHEAASSARADG